MGKGREKASSWNMRKKTSEKAARQELLHALFTAGDAANLFVVLRKSELLPDEMSGLGLAVST